METNRNPLKAEGLSNLIDQITLIRKMDAIRSIGVDQKSGRSRRDLSGIIQFHSSIPVKRRR
jgi:hypothetical protein